MINKSSIRTLRALHHHFIIPFSGFSSGLFIWNLKGAGSLFFYILIVTCLLYLFLFVSAFITSRLSNSRLNDVLRKDVYAFLPMSLFLIFPVKDLFTASTPYFNYLMVKYCAGVLIIPIGSMVVFLKILLLPDLSRYCGRRILQRKLIYCFLFALAGLYAGTFSYYSIFRHINLNSGVDPLGF